MKPTYIIIALCLVILFLGWKGCATERAKKDLVSQYEKLLADSSNKIRHWKDAYGNEHAEKQVLILDQDIMESQIRDMADRLNIKPKQIKGETIYIDNTNFSKRVDTVYRDRWVEIRRGKNDTISVSMNDTIIQTNYWKRKWFLAPKRYYVDISTTSPYTHIKDVKSLEVKKKNPTFILGLSTTYNPINNRITPGITIMWYPATIRF